MKATSYLIPKPDFIPVGKYTPTDLDDQKQKADMLITSCDGGSFTINTNGIELSGRGVKHRYDNGYYEVTEGMLNKLRAKYNIMTDF